MSQKAAIWSFPGKHAALTFIVPKIFFGYLVTKLGSLSVISQKKKRFSFLFTKTRCTHTKNMFWSVFRKVVLFPALLHGKKVFFQFADLVLLKTTFFLLYG